MNLVNMLIFASDALVLAVIVCNVYVCMCVCHTQVLAKRRITQATPRDSPGTLVFLRQDSLVEDHPSPEIVAQSDPPFFEHHKHIIPLSNGP